MTFELERDAIAPFSPSNCSAPIRVAYADPPYLGKSAFGAEHHYGRYHPEAAECDKLEWHAELIKRLVVEYPDGWALSLHSPSLRDLLPLCPEDVRIAAWVKPFCSWKPGVNPAYAWEPVIWRGGRKRERWDEKVRDFAAINIRLRSGFPGAKPAAFVRWMLDLLNAQKHDTIDDLFPGSGAVTREIEAWRNDRTLWEPNDQAHR